MTDHQNNDKTQTHIVLTKGTMVSHYRIIEKIGAGGMGEVYLAEDTKLDRKVALKFLPPHLCRDEDCRKRFKREAQAAARLGHANIVAVHEVGEYQDRPWFSMENVEGTSLDFLIKSGGLTEDKIIDLVIGISNGLRIAHESGIVHRDVKPSNILVDRDGCPRVLDFGLAVVRDTAKLTQTGSTLGTIGYMSPEQVEGREVDSRSDLFSLGVVLYELLAGCNPFKRDNQAATIKAILQDDPQPVTRYRSGVSEGLQHIIAKLLQKRQELRYQSATDVIEDLNRFRRKLKQNPSSEREQPSIAVLPFVNLSADPEQDYFCDGMSEEIINALTRIKNLRVIARTSAFAFKGKQEDIREIGHRLDVTALLEGSVRKVGNRVRITAQLVQASDGSHLWSDRFDRELEDIFTIQDEISEAIVRQLKVKLTLETDAESAGRQVKNIEAYNHYLTGRFFWNKRTPIELKKAIKYFQKAIDIDPKLAVAYTGLADCYSMLVQVWQIEPTEAFPKARSLAEEALAIDETVAEAHASLALVRWQYDWDWPGAEQEINRARELNPGYATAIQWHALFLATIGRRSQALIEIGKALELDPLSLILIVCSAWIHLTNGDYDEAAEQCRIALERDPSYSWSHIPLAWLYTVRGLQDEAIEEYLAMERDFEPIGPDVVDILRETYKKSGWDAYWLQHIDILKERRKEGFIPASAIATDYVRIGQVDQAFEWLERSFKERDPELSYLRVHPILSGLESDPRFQALLKKVRLT